jgi:hypothetical protein
MTHEQDRARRLLIPKHVTGLIPLILAATWAILPRFAHATRHAEQTTRQSAAPARHENQGPHSVPQTLSVIGRVVNPNGQPVPGAKLYLYGDPGERLLREPVSPPVRAITDPDGRFRFNIERSELASAGSRPRFPGPLFAAFAQGYGPVWTDDLMIGDPDGALLELVADDPPITGRLIDLEGRPLPDVEVRVIQVDATPENDLSAWLDEIQKNRKKPTGYQSFNHFSKSLPFGLATLIPPAKTASNGRFQLTGAGRERLVSLLIQGPKIETRILQVMTRIGPSSSVGFALPNVGQPFLTSIVIHAIGFDFVAAPTRAVEGNVNDAATGLPLPGVIIRPRMKFRDAFNSLYPLIDWPSMSIRTTTDVRGRYRLTGLPVRQPIELRTELAETLPYRPSSQQFAHTPGIDPTRWDFRLERGVLIQGKITDRTTGGPVAAVVEYRPTLHNPNIRSIDQIELFEPVSTHPDGSFTLVALPGPGLVAATAMGDRFLTADRATGGKSSAARPFPNIRGFTSPQQCHAFEAISLEKTAKSYQCDLTLTPGPEPIVTILDPHGKPLAGALIGGALPTDLIREGWWQSRQQSEFRVTGLTSHRIRNLSVHHEGKRLAGSIAIRDSEPGPLVARLRPWGTVSGRLIDRDGHPRPGVTLSYRDTISGIRPDSIYLPKDATTDANGHFTFEGLVPGQEYIIKLPAPSPEAQPSRVGESHVLEPGEVKTLGDVREVAQ